MTPSEKQKEIACAFAWYFYNLEGDGDAFRHYDRWLLTEESKRLTGETQQESSYDLLVKISGQLDRIEGNMKLMKE